MQTEWDYTALAAAYLKRPDYADALITGLLEKTHVSAGDRVCDIGAGAAHLTLQLAARGLDVTAVEPNDAMREQGIRRTRYPDHAGLPHTRPLQVQWIEATGEDTGLPGGAFRLVAFGSSFNVTDRPRALRESARLLGEGGWFACLWNHRDLADPLQASIEGIIADTVERYDYGARREDQTGVIEASGLFGPVTMLEGAVVHQQAPEDVIEAWRSHATLQRQAGPAFGRVVDRIAERVRAEGAGPVSIPYVTRAWLAQRRSG